MCECKLLLKIMAVLAKVSTLRERLPSVIVEYSMVYRAPSFGCSSFFVYRGLCKNRSIDVRGRMQCNLYGPHILYSVHNFRRFFDVYCSYIIMIVSALYVCLFHVQLLCWGVRDMKSFLLQSVNSPTVEVRCGDVQFTQTLHIKDASKNPNFPGPRPFIIQDMVLN